MSFFVNAQKETTPIALGVSFGMLSDMGSVKSEGFNYLGLGGIFLLLILIITSIFRFKDLNFYKLKPFILIFILFTLTALTNKIYFEFFMSK